MAIYAVRQKLRHTAGGGIFASLASPLRSFAVMNHHRYSSAGQAIPPEQFVCIRHIEVLSSANSSVSVAMPHPELQLRDTGKAGVHHGKVTYTPHLPVIQNPSPTWTRQLMRMQWINGIACRMRAPPPYRYDRHGTEKTTVLKGVIRMAMSGLRHY